MLEVDPNEKQDLYEALGRDGLTLKDWFLGQARNYLQNRNQTETCRKACADCGIEFSFKVITEDFILSASLELAGQSIFARESIGSFTHAIFNPPYKKFRSGQSNAEFAACHGISHATLRKWIYRRRAKVGAVNQGDSSLGGFVPVRMKTPAADCASSVLVRCPSGHEVVLPGSLGMSTLQTLMTTLLKSC